MEEFQLQSRDLLEQALNRLQATTLLITELESQVAEAGRTVQGLSLVIEQFIEQSLNRDNGVQESSSEGSDTPNGGLSQ